MHRGYGGYNTRMIKEVLPVSEELMCLITTYL